MFIDIDATMEHREPNYDMIESIASECFMPVCYGGGVKRIDQMKKIFSLGIEKISLSSLVVESPAIIKEAVRIFGGQSIIVTVDIKKDFLGRKKVFMYNAKKNTKYNPIDFIKNVIDLGVGEIVLNSIDNDGMMTGYDLELLENIKKLINIPLIALGGAGKLDDILKVVDDIGISASAGSLFVYHGALRGVLISYPTPNEIEKYRRN